MDCFAVQISLIFKLYGDHFSPSGARFESGLCENCRCALYQSHRTCALSRTSSQEFA
jgi:hypothetical protein